MNIFLKYIVINPDLAVLKLTRQFVKSPHNATPAHTFSYYMDNLIITSEK